MHARQRPTALQRSINKTNLHQQLPDQLAYQFFLLLMVKLVLNGYLAHQLTYQPCNL